MKLLTALLGCILALSAPSIFAAPTSATDTPVTDSSTPGATTTVGVKIPDADLSANVKAQLTQESTLAGANIQAQANNGIVTLEGSVANKAQEDKAVAIAKSVNGVQDVKSNLTLTNKS